MLKIIDSSLYDESGNKLKDMVCPKTVSDIDLSKKTGFWEQCIHCNRSVADTDMMREVEIVRLIEANPEVCLKINRFHPDFNFE